VLGNKLKIAVVLIACTDCWGGEALYESPVDLYPLGVDDSIVLEVPGAERELPLRVMFPEEGGPYPVIVLSHGTFSSGKRYDRVAGYWAARGYVIILPDHVDANYGVMPKKNEDMFQVIRDRVTDMSLVLDGLDEIESQNPALRGRMDRRHLIAAGHSVGTQVAMMVTGLRVKNPTTDEVMESDEARFSLLIMLSDPGKMALMPAQTWQGSTVPTFLSTGTEDYGLMGDGRRTADYQNEILSGAESTDIDRYQLLIERADHYFGGLIHKDVDAEPDHEGLAVFNAVSTAFLDAYAKDAPAARTYLQSAEIQAATDGRAKLIRSRQVEEK